MGGKGSGTLSTEKKEEIRERWAVDGENKCHCCDKLIQENKINYANTKGKRSKDPINYIILCDECDGDSKTIRLPRWIDKNINSYIEALDENVQTSLSSRKELIGILFDSLSKNLVLPNNRDLKSLKENWISIEKDEMLKSNGLKDFEDYCNHLIAVEILKSDKMKDLLMQALTDDENWNELIEQVKYSPGYNDFREKSIPLRTFSQSIKQNLPHQSSNWRLGEIISAYLQNILVSEAKIKKIYSNEIEENARSLSKKIWNENFADLLNSEEEIIWFSKSAYFEDLVEKGRVTDREHYRKELLKYDNSLKEETQKLIYEGIIDSIFDIFVSDLEVELKVTKEEILDKIRPLNFDNKISPEIKQELVKLFEEMKSDNSSPEDVHKRINEILKKREKIIDQRLGWKISPPSIMISEEWANLEEEFGEIKNAESIQYEKDEKEAEEAYGILTRSSEIIHITDLELGVEERSSIRYVNIPNIHANNNNYTGDMNFLDNAHGNGKYIDDEIDYEGEWWNGKMHGEGHLIWMDPKTQQIEAIYEGNFKQGKPHGRGKISWYDIEQGLPDGNYYVGEMEYGLMHGLGEYFYENGGIHKVKYVRGHKSGFGEMNNENSVGYLNRSRVVKKESGIWRNWKKTGKVVKEVRIRKTGEIRNQIHNFVYNKEKELGNGQIFQGEYVEIDGELHLRDGVLTSYVDNTEIKIRGSFSINNRLVKGTISMNGDVIEGEFKPAIEVLGENLLENLNSVIFNGTIKYKNKDVFLSSKGVKNYAPFEISEGYWINALGLEREDITQYGNNISIHEEIESKNHYWNGDKWSLVEIAPLKKSQKFWRENNLGILHPKEWNDEQWMNKNIQRRGYYWNWNDYKWSLLSEKPIGGKLITENGIFEGVFSKIPNSFRYRMISGFVRFQGNRGLSLFYGEFNNLKVDTGKGREYHKIIPKYGRLIFANNEKYKGEFGFINSIGVPEGRGILRCNNGDIHRGIFKTIQKNPDEGTSYLATWMTEGTITRQNGKIYEGKFSLHEKEYEGLFDKGFVIRNHIPQLDEGTLTFKNGNTYVGSFRGLNPRGQGCLTIFESGEKITKNFEKLEISDDGLI